MTSPVFALRADRSLRFSNDWDGECLAFDRLSSDLFVVPEVGRQVLERLAQVGPMDGKTLLSEIFGAEGSDDEGGAEAIESLLREFTTCALIEPFCADCCGSDEH